MKIIIVLPSFENAGPIKVALTSCISLVKLNISVDVFSFNDNGYYYDEFLVCADNIHLSKGFVNGFLSLRKLLNEKEFNVIHSHGLKPDIASYLLSLSSNSLHCTTLHCDLLAYYLTDFGFMGGAARWYLHSRILRRLGHVLCVSSSIQKISKLKNSSVLHNAVQKRGGIRNRKANRTLIYLGRVSKEKNLTFLINALAHHPIDISVKIIGDGSCLGSVKKLAEDNSIPICFTGFLDNFMDELDPNCIFVNPSLTEGMPMAALEMISLGIPLLLSNIPAHSELEEIISNPRYLKLFDFNYASFNEALSSMLCFDEENWHSIEKVFEDNFSVGSYGKRLENAYLNSLSERN